MDLSHVWLLVVLFACHWLGDFTHLSTNWMLSAKRFGTPFGPILAHAGVHGLLMGFALLFWPISWSLWLQLVFVQVFTHSVIDLLKGRVNFMFPPLQSPANKAHWYVFGFDQLLHAVVIIKMVSFV